MTALCVRVGPPDGVLTALEEGVRAHLELDVHAAADAARALELIEGSAADPLLLIAHGHPPSHEGFPDLRCDGGFFASGRVARASGSPAAAAHAAPMP